MMVLPHQLLLAPLFDLRKREGLIVNNSEVLEVAGIEASLLLVLDSLILILALA